MGFIKNVAKKSFLVKVLTIFILIQSLFLVNTFIIAQDTPQNLYNQYGIINDQVLIHFLDLETPLNKSIGINFRSETTLVGTTFYSFVANGSQTGEIMLLRIDFNENFTAIVNQEMYVTPLNNKKSNYGLATNNSHFWVIEHEGESNKTIDLDNKTYHLTYHNKNIVGFTLDRTVFANQTLSFDDVYTHSYLQELDRYMPEGLSEDSELPYPLRIQYWNESLYILEGIGVFGYGLLQLNANSLEREVLKTMAFQNYGRYHVRCGSATFNIDDEGTLWVDGARGDIYRYNIMTGDRLEIVEQNPYSLGNLTDYNFINGTYYPPAFIFEDCHHSQAEVTFERAFNIGGDNKIIKLLSAKGFCPNGTRYETVVMLLGFRVYSFERITFMYPWSSPIFWGGGIGLCLALVVIILVREKYFPNKS